MNAWANPAKKVNESYAGILLHHNFTSCKGFSWITSDYLSKRREIAGYMSAFQCVIDIFSNKLNNAHSWSSISKNKCGLCSEKANQYPVFSSSCYSTQHFYMEWSCNKTEIYANINLAIVATCSVYLRYEKNKQTIFSIISITFSML